MRRSRPQPVDICPSYIGVYSPTIGLAPIGQHNRGQYGPTSDHQIEHSRWQRIASRSIRMGHGRAAEQPRRVRQAARS